MDLFGIKIDLGYLDGAHLNGQYAIFLDTYMIYAIVLTLFISFLLIALLIGTMCRNFKDRIYKTLKNLKDKFIWSGLIQSISIAYLNQAVGVLLIFNLLYIKEL